jgi:hypothetical protein
VRRLRPSSSLLLVLALACQRNAGTTTPPGDGGGGAATAGNTVAASAAKAEAKAVPRVSDDPTIQAIVELGTTESKVDEHLEYLTKRIGARLTGSHALMTAERWARDRFASYGLTATLERWGEVPVGFDRGPWSGRMVAPTTMELDFTTRAWSPGAFGPVRGRAVPYPESVAQAKAEAKRYVGAWVLVPPRTPGTPPDRERLAAIDDVLAATSVAGFVERARDPGGKLVHTGGEHGIDWAKLPRDTRVQLRGEQYDELSKRVAGGEVVELEFSIDNRFFKGPVPQHNVIADLLGSELPGEYVIVGGHLDSWDGAEGAVDNGTGCATTLEAARLLVAAGAKPRRTIRFMLWSGEEQGLLGSTAYVGLHPELVDRTKVVLVHDGGTNFLSGLRVTPEMADDMKRVFAPVMALDPKLPFGLWYAESLRKGGSDHTPFIDKGIPAFFWEQDGRADYEYSHHTQYDTLDFAISEYQRHSAMVVAIAALGFANLDHELDRTDSAALPRRDLGAEFEGNRVTKLTKGGRAAKAGIKLGDEVLEVEGQPGSRWELLRRINQPGVTKSVTLARKGKRITVTLDFTGDPADAEREARTARRQKRFGNLDYDKPFAGKALPKPPAPAATAP